MHSKCCGAKSFEFESKFLFLRNFKTYNLPKCKKKSEASLDLREMKQGLLLPFAG